MPDLPPNNQPIKPTSALPALTSQDLILQQQAQNQQQQNNSLIDQQKAQRDADKFKKSIFRKIQNKTIAPGSLITFRYNFYHKDPSPLCLVGRVSGGMVSGLNLHYLTFPYVKKLVSTYCGKNFQYQLIKGNKYITNAYRSYKAEGRKNVQILDCDFLMGVLGSVKSFKPTELEAIRNSVQKQLQEKLHPTSDDVAKQFQQQVRNQEFDINKIDGRLKPFGMGSPEVNPE